MPETFVPYYVYSALLVEIKIIYKIHDTYVTVVFKIGMMMMMIMIMMIIIIIIIIIINY
jgi:hypothetical protein